MNKLKTSLLIVLFSLGIVESQAVVGNRPVHEVHSMMMYNFIRFVEWPESERSGDFRIAVVGNREVFETLNKLYGSKTKGNQKLNVKNYRSSADVPDDIQMVYLAGSATSEFDQLQSRFSGSSVLIVTNSDDLGNKGSNINFIEDGDRMKFELNEASFEKHNLKVASQLKSLAIVI